MPTYEYECLECAHRFEAFQSIKEEPLTLCGRCGGTVKKRIVAGAGIIFKGSGFYVTDYKKGSAAPEKKEDTPAKSTEACAACSNKKSDSAD